MEKICANVVTYNRKDLLRECLNALLAQTCKLDSIIIIDNASNDGTLDMLKREFLYDKVFDYVRLEENIGSSGGQYTGMKRAYEKGFDWIWVMDDDAAPEKDCLKELLEYKRAADIITPKVVHISGKIEKEHRGLLSFNLNQIPFEAEYNLVTPVKIDYFSFVGPLINKKIILKVGLPNIDFFIWHDDLEYSIRIKKYFKLLLINKAIIFHNDPYKQGKGIHSWKYFFAFRNKLNILIKNKGFYGYFLSIFIFSKKFIYFYFSKKFRKEIKLLWISFNQGLLNKFDNNKLR
jgi:GT2 family glycosyltransferase